MIIRPGYGNIKFEYFMINRDGCSASYKEIKLLWIGQRHLLSEYFKKILVIKAVVNHYTADK